MHKKSEKEAIAGWKQDLRILQIFDVRLVGHTRRPLIVSPSDGAVDGYPFDTFGPQPSPSSRSGIYRRPTRIGKQVFLSVEDITLIVS